MAHLLIVDDEPSICWGFEKLAGDMGHTAETAASAEEGFRLVEVTRPDLMVLDIRLPGMDGLTAMRRFQEILGPVPIIVITAFGALSTAVEAVRRGAFEYLTKPFDLKTVRETIRRGLLVAPTADATAVASERDESEEPILGQSPKMQAMFKRIALAAASDACIHLQGESGTGKDLVARAIHRNSRRADGPFVPINLAALSPTLAESELFGHARGAFTGADQERKGLLEHADGGTVFLDEIGDMPPAIQVKLLRALEQGEFMPVGTNRAVRSNFRVLSATHRDLSTCVAEGRFRHDLYYRVNTFTIEVPPLRERERDIPLLVSHFLNWLAEKNGTPVPTISPEAVAELESRPWNGNVRELRNAVEHAMVLARNGTIMPAHLPLPMDVILDEEKRAAGVLPSLIRQWARNQLGEEQPADEIHAKFLELVEPPFLKSVLKQSKGSCAAAARILGLHRTTLKKKLEQYQIEID